MTARASTLAPFSTIVDRVRAPASSLRVLAVLFVAVLTAAASQVSFPLPFTPVPPAAGAATSWSPGLTLVWLACRRL